MKYTTHKRAYVYHYYIDIIRYYNENLFLTVYPGLGYVEIYINVILIMYMNSGKC